MKNIDRSTIALILGIAAFAVVLAAGLVALGMVSDSGGNASEEYPYAAFTFTETNVTIHTPNESSYARALVVEHRAGMELPQDQVYLQVNGERAWDIEEHEGGGSRTVATWNRSGDIVTMESARIVGFGEIEEGGNVAVGMNRNEFQLLQEGDVIEVMWEEPGGERRTVLQRFEVESE